MADNDRVSFTRQGAQRISRAVRIVEGGERDTIALSFERVGNAKAGTGLKLGTFTGNWDIGTYATVTLTGTTNTVSVYNWCNPALGANTANTTEARYVIFGKVSGTQSAVEIQMRSTATECTATMVLGSFDLTQLPGYDADDIQLLGHSAGNTTGDTSCTARASLQWYSITTCSTG